MQPLSHLECFVKSAQVGSFSAAARLLELTPAAVSKKVARLEASLGVRLFQRSTRKLTLTEGGERLLQQIGGPLAALADAIDHAAEEDKQPAGTLRVSMGQAFGRAYVVPLLDEFLRRYPAVVPDWRFDNRQADLIGEGFDAGIGSGLDLKAGMVARELGRIQVVAVAAPAYLKGRPRARHPADLAALDGIVRRSSQNNRLYQYTLRHQAGEVAPALLRTRVVFDDPEAMCQAALMGLGVALVPMPFAVPGLQSGALVRVLPGWAMDAGPVSLYYPAKKLLPARTRVFVDFVVEQFRERGFARLIQAG
ncbi:LysR family transcriptional regulator [Pseudorhodoferax sp. Leaf267]|uniref:LysR family transcriptional regulator n=1 Tax=Pseudorhodoferax sp. Leaf267 TaxID=1736316 RepID=UPI0006FE3706|nr:LysR family transcriptional regulator [Pseudorhodoferax sp. Leaf267]KQP18363.1 LysR family transcriptional regulator [Pseudorhodoferax sp. Leaf267]